MKMHVNFDLAAESGKITTNDFSAELGKIECPISFDIEFEAAEVQQTIGLMRDLVKEIPGLIKQHQDGELNLAEKRAKLEADNIRLKADLAEQTSKMAHVRAIDLVRLKADLEHHDIPAEPDSAVVSAEPEPDRATGRKHTKV